MRGTVAMTVSEIAEYTVQHASTTCLALRGRCWSSCGSQASHAGRRSFLGAVDRVGLWVTRAVVLAVAVIGGAYSYVRWYESRGIRALLGVTALPVTVALVVVLALRWRGRTDGAPAARWHAVPATERDKVAIMRRLGCQYGNDLASPGPYRNADA